MGCFGGVSHGGGGCRKNRRVEDHHLAEVFSYRELQVATDNFAARNVVGHGGFGSVYKGRLKNGRAVAVKVLSEESRQGSPEFVNELHTMSQLRHRNLARLRGCCAEGGRRILVYDYVANKSLRQALLELPAAGRARLGWRTRAEVCRGVAAGLAFLHEQVRPPVVHRDIKASNVLLDDDWTPKISDFGLAKLFPATRTHISTRVAGTLGYLAPEYAILGHLTKKADVYSFGILMLEIISGRCNTIPSSACGEQFLLEKAWTLYKQGRLLDAVDLSLNGDFNAKEADKFLRVALLCMQYAPRTRPSMSRVVMMLQGRCRVSREIMHPGLITDPNDLKVQEVVPPVTPKSCSSDGTLLSACSPVALAQTITAIELR